MSKNKILVWIEEPSPSEIDKASAYRAILCDKLHPSQIQIEEGVALSPNCWLLSREVGVGTLAKIVSAADSHKLKYGVHILYHTKKLTLAELREYVRSTLPENTAFWVCVPQEDEFVPTPQDEAKKR